MQFFTKIIGKVTVISLKGNLLGGPDAAALNTRLHEVVASGGRYVVVDLAGVEFMNSSGLGLLIGGATTMKTAGGALKLAAASPKVAAIFTMTRLGPVFELHPSVDAAVASFGG
jgi:anti-sigma B factor antagonist